jgi:murein DD-endopeptidase MepM/ murein hydrolase activator NlpD
MRELSGEQRTEHKGYQDVSPPPEPNQVKGWLWHGFAALGVSALGLAVAAAVGLTTHAQTNRDMSAVPDTFPTVATAPVQKNDKNSEPKDPALAAFSRRDKSAGTDTSRSAALRQALAKEQAAQRDEQLAKTAEEINRAAQSASSDARQKELELVNRATREEAAQIAEENLRRAIAARIAAANRRQAAERESTGPEEPSSQQGDGDSASGSGNGDSTSGSGDGGGGAPDRSSTGSSNSGSGSGGGSSGGGSGSGSGGGGSASPVPGAVIGAHFGEYGSWSRYHTGIDFRAGHGTPIRAVKAGVVLYAGNSGDWAGNHVAIKHGDGMTTMSSHMSSMAVNAGQTVRAGQVIGYVGQTGRAFGAHLHFELYPAGIKYGDVYKAINPQPWLATNGVTTH